MKLNIKISTLIFLMCFLFQSSYSQQNTSGWYWINSQPQGQTLKWAKIIDATHYYAVGDAGTFMKSSDGGDTWLINSQAGITEGLFGSGGTNNLNSAWFFDANTGIVVGQSVSGDGGKIKRTTDGGETFSTIGLGIPSGLATVNSIYFINSTTGYLCGNNTVKAFKTTDAGLSWTLLPNLPTISLTYGCVYAKDANNIFLGTNTDGSANSRRIVRTTNAGATWKIDTLPGATIYSVTDIKFQNATTGFLSASTNYFAYTTNGGSNWTQAIFPNTQQALYQLQVVGSAVYTIGSYNSYYYTSNLGVTWDSVVFNDPSNPYQPYPFLVYAFNINGNDAIVVGANGKVNVSNDGGSSWRNKNYSVGNNQYPFSSIYAQPGTQNVWTGSNGGGLILYSSNNGTNWVEQPTGAPNAIYDIQMLNSNTGYACGGNAFAGTGYCYKTVNGGTTWTSLSITQPGYQINALDFVDVNTGWIVGGLPFNSGSVISKTTNGGVTWTDQVTNPMFLSALGHVDMANSNTGYITSGSFVVKTTNGGTNWDQITVSPTVSWNKVQTFPNNTLYLGGAQTVNKSTDGGVTWSSVNIPSALATIFNMDWWDLNNGTVTGTAGYTAKTTDGGITWKERNPGSSTITGVSMQNRDTVFASCDRNVFGAIFRLYDNSNAITANLTIGIEGFWNGTTQVPDTVKCHLRNSVSPYNEIAVSSALLNNSGNGTFTFPTAPSGSYYLEITHRNALETWSAAPQAIVQGGSFNYNFTTAASQAFGNNTLLSEGRYCFYEGDVNQEGSVNLTDLLQVYNSASNFTSGYVVDDVNGNNFVDLTDILITFNNAADFITKITP